MFSLKLFSGLLSEKIVLMIMFHPFIISDFELSNLTRKTKGRLRNRRFYAPRMKLL